MTLEERLRKPFDREGFRKRLSDPPSSMNPASAEIIADGMGELADRIGGVHDTLDSKIDSVHDKLDSKIDSVHDKLDSKIDSVHDKLDRKIDEVNENINLHFERAYPDRDFTDLYTNGDEAEED